MEQIAELTHPGMALPTTLSPASGKEGYFLQPPLYFVERGDKRSDVGVSQLAVQIPPCNHIESFLIIYLRNLYLYLMKTIKLLCILVFYVSGYVSAQDKTPDTYTL